MKHSKYPLILVPVLAALFVPGGAAISQVPSVPSTTIRIASLAPPGSSFVKVLKAWSRTLAKETEGRVDLRVFSGGSEGSDRDLVKRIKSGQLDAAGVATTGLSMVAPELQVLTAPGLLTDDAQLDRAREKLGAQLQKLIEDGGFKLLAWGDGGKNRVFASGEFHAPADLAGRRAWAGTKNAVGLEYVKALGANPVRIGASGVLPGLTNGKLDVVPASAMAAVAFQWYTKLKFVTSTNFNIIVGGSIISKKKFDELSDADQKTLLDTAGRAAAKLDEIVARDDARAYQTLLGRGIQEVDTSKNRADWESAAKKAREQLAQNGAYSKSLLKAVEAAAQN